MMPNIRSACIQAAVTLGLAGCAADLPQSTTTRGLDTGITAANGGATQVIGNSPNTGVISRTSP